MSPLPTKMKAPGRAFSMKEKSSAPITGGAAASTRAAPTTSAATRAAKSVWAAALTVTG